MVLATTVGSTSSSSTCSTCQATFIDRFAQRAHFKSDWHVTNLKRRIELLEPVSPVGEDLSALENRPSSISKHAAAESQAKHDLATNTGPGELVSFKNAPSTTGVGSIALKAFDPSLCLFCMQKSPSLHENLVHMQQAHGFTIPHQGNVIDLESFLNYLFALVMNFHECIYCGITKPTSRAIQQHMITKQHCSIGEVTEESDYCDFYDLAIYEAEDDASEQAADMVENVSRSKFKTQANYVSLPSGKTLGSRLTTQSNDSRRRLPQRQHGKLVDRQEIRNANLDSSDVEDANELQSKPSRQLTIRTGDETGLTGVSDARKRALRATEKKDLRISIRARNRYQAGLEKMANNQKHFNEDSPGLGAHNTRY